MPRLRACSAQEKDGGVPYGCASYGRKIFCYQPVKLLDVKRAAQRTAALSQGRDALCSH
jgi:hypothetical protein